VTRLTAYVSALVALDLALFSAIVPLLPQLSDRLDLTKVQSGPHAGDRTAYALLAVLSFGAAAAIGHLARGMRAEPTIP